MPDIRRRRIPVAAGVSAAAFIVYLLTLHPSVDFIDAGELATVAVTLGIAHPTGYPTFTIAAWIWSHLPIGDEIYRLNIFSALLCAAGAGVWYLILRMLFSLPRGARKNMPAKGAPKGRQKQAKETESAPAADPLTPLFSAFGALAIAFGETYWSTALSIEVYSLHCFFLAVVLYYFLRALLFPPEAEGSAWRRERHWLLFAFFLGLSFTNHLTTILLAPACIYYFFARMGAGGKGEKGSGMKSHSFLAGLARRESWRKIAIAVPPFAAGLLPYIYLPIRSASQPALNWGFPATWERFIWHVSGKQYRVWIFSSTEAAGKQLSFFLRTFPAEFGYLLLPLILIGIVAAFRLGRRLGAFLLLLFLGCVLYSINYDIHDIESYFLLAYVVSGIYAALGARALARWIAKGAWPAYAIAGAGLAALLWSGFTGTSQRGNYLVEDYTANMFRSLEPNALVISYQWDYFVSASCYYQYVKGVRPDVTVIDKELLRRSWYLRQLRKNHPEIYDRSRPEIEAFLAELWKFEHDVPYDPGTIEQAYNGMINSFIDRAIERRPVYLTIEIEQQFAPGYLRVPEGLAFRLYRSAPPPGKRVFEDFTIRPFTHSGRLVDGIRGMYGAMLINRARFCALQGEAREGMEAADRALKLNPDNEEAMRWREIAQDSLEARRIRSRAAPPPAP